MANTRRQPPEKISADCPHCGFSQLESAFAKSTFCRKCGEHYSIEKLLAKEAGSLSGPGFLERLSKIISRETVREISCFSCAATQQVSSAAESSLCPKCGSYIDLRDFKITGPFGRSIQTQGEVIISSKGDLSSQRVLCGGARIEGKMRGQMVCTGTVAVRLEGQLLGGIESHKVVIEKRSAVDLMKPLQAQEVEINGKSTGVILCSGRVTINKHGSLQGVIHARSIVIEKGGIFSGELHIGEEANLDVEPAAAVPPVELPAPSEPEPSEPVPTEAPEALAVEETSTIEGTVQPEAELPIIELKPPKSAPEAASSSSQEELFKPGNAPAKKGSLGGKGRGRLRSR